MEYLLYTIRSAISLSLQNLFFPFRQNKSPSLDLEEEDPAIIPNVLLSEISLLQTVLNLRNGKLTKQILQKKDFNFFKMDHSLKNLNKNSIPPFVKHDQVKDY